MTRVDAWLLHISVALTTASGVVFAVFRYLVVSDDPFAAANHPLEPYALDTHILFAPVAMFAFGLIFHSHIWRKYRSHAAARRRSGLTLIALIVPMALSGYLLQVSADETLREAMKVTHWVTSAVFALGYLVHQFARRVSRKNVALPVN